MLNAGPSLRERVLAAVRRKADSAWRISQRLGENPSSVSGCLHRLWSEGIIDRKAGGGPRGGYLYRLYPRIRKPRLRMPPPGRRHVDRKKRASKRACRKNKGKH